MINTLLQHAARLPKPLLPARVQWLLCAALALLCLAAAARLGVLLVSERELPAVRFPLPPGQQSPRISLYPESGPVGGGEVLTEATFNGRLMGIVHLEGRALASIASQGGRERIYHIGDTLAPGVTLEGIEPSRVLVRERGTLRQLSLKSPPGDGGPIIAPTAAGEPSLAVATTPVLGGDGQSGLRIDALDPELAALGLVQNGDLVVAVDGVGLSALMADDSAMAELVQRDNLTLTVVRDGDEITVDIGGEVIQSLLGRM